MIGLVFIIILISLKCINVFLIEYPAYFDLFLMIVLFIKTALSTSSFEHSKFNSAIQKYFSTVCMSIPVFAAQA